MSPSNRLLFKLIFGLSVDVDLLNNAEALVEFFLCLLVAIFCILFLFQS